MDKKRIVIGISGASGAIYGIELLKVLKKLDTIETHLIISKAAGITIKQETDLSVGDVQALADVVYQVDDIAAAVSSGSFVHHGMIIAPCSIKTMSEVACGITSNLISRAADVTLKEQRKLVLMLRETPLHAGHLASAQKLASMGAVIAPPVPAFYNKPTSIDEIVKHSVGRVLDMFDIGADIVKRWK